MKKDCDFSSPTDAEPIVWSATKAKIFVADQSSRFD